MNEITKLNDRKMRNLRLECAEITSVAKKARGDSSRVTYSDFPKESYCDTTLIDEAQVTQL